MEEIGSFRLANQGGFVARLEFVYRNEAGNRVRVGGSGNIALGQSATVDPGLHGVADGAEVTVYVVVVAGNNNESDTVFIYRSGLQRTADFTITGTTLSNRLRFNGIILPPGVGDGGGIWPPAGLCCQNIIWALLNGCGCNAIPWVLLNSCGCNSIPWAPFDGCGCDCGCDETPWAPLDGCGCNSIPWMPFAG